MTDSTYSISRVSSWNNKSATIDVTHTKTDLSYSILGTPRGQSSPQQFSFDEEIKWDRLGQFENLIDKLR
jgi:hypothetical protein